VGNLSPLSLSRKEEEEEGREGGRGTSDERTSKDEAFETK